MQQLYLIVCCFCMCFFFFFFFEFVSFIHHSKPTSNKCFQCPLKLIEVYASKSPYDLFHAQHSVDPCLNCYFFYGFFYFKNYCLTSFSRHLWLFKIEAKCLHKSLCALSLAIQIFDEIFFFTSVYSEKALSS